MIKLIGGLKTYYEAAGSGEPVLLLHGWANDVETLRPLMRMVLEMGFRVFSVDLPGFGLSDTPEDPWGVDEYVNFVCNFLNELALERVSIIGHSFGGRIAIKLAANYPLRTNKIILVDSAGIKPDRSVGSSLSAFFTKLIRKVIPRLPSSIGRLLRDNLLSKMGSRDYRNAGKLRSTFVKVVNEDLRPTLPCIKSPVLLVWGELDRETPLSDGRLMKDLIPDAQLDVIHGAGHHCFLDNPDAFLKIIKPFLLRDK